MLTIDVRSNIPAALAKLDNFRRDQLPFATAKALTDTAGDVQKELTETIPRALDRPIPYTRNSVWKTPATKRRLTAVVGLVNEAFKGTPPSKYLRALILGGERKNKRFEGLLRRAGMLGPNEFLVPGQAAPIDNFGNVPQGFIVQMLSALQAFQSAGYSMNRTRASGQRLGSRAPQFFWSRGDRGLPRGIWQRFPPQGKGGERQDGYVRPIFIAVSRQAYKQQFKFYEIAKAKAIESFPARFHAAAQYAMATAR